MPPSLKKLDSLTNDVSICFSGTEIPGKIVDIITSDLQNSLKATFNKGQKFRTVTDGKLFFIQGAPLESEKNRSEQLRQLGSATWEEMSRQGFKRVQLAGSGVEFIAQGLALRDYRFETYKRDPSRYGVEEIQISRSDISDLKIRELEGLTKAIFFARDLVNEPANVLTATELSNRISKAGESSGYKVEVLHIDRIKALKMGGLLSVNQGSTKEPTFTIIEYKPKNASNNKPVVLVGKGIVYDTGGLSLKPTANSMDMMKCDMGGAAAVVGAIHASALNEIPLHVIGLIPATDNQPGPDAYAPGDVITMYDGTCVEVMNTDAEGRLVMADALAFAKQYSPFLVMDLATLTGSSMRAIGNYAGAMMGTADEDTKKTLIHSGFRAHERIIEFPLWDDYATDLHSDIADTRNLGPTPMADVIIAGKFLEKFTDYPWMHVDIAGPAYLPSSRGYLPKGGTGFGVHLLYEFFKKLSA